MKSIRVAEAYYNDTQEQIRLLKLEVARYKEVCLASFAREDRLSDEVKDLKGQIELLRRTLDQERAYGVCSFTDDQDAHSPACHFFTDGMAECNCSERNRRAAQ